MKKLVFIAIVFLCLPTAALALPVTVFGPQVTTDSDYQSWLGPRQKTFVAQGRIGDRGGSATYEIGLHGPPDFTNAGPIPDTGPGGEDYTQWPWVSGQGVAFTLSRQSGLLSFDMGDYSASLADPLETDLFAFRYRVAAGSRLNIMNLQYGTEQLAPYLVLDNYGGTDSAVLYWALENFDQDFILSGLATLSWQGTAPSNSQLAFQIKGYNGPPIPEPSTIILLGLGFGLFGLAAYKRKKIA